MNKEKIMEYSHVHSYAPSLGEPPPPSDPNIKNQQWINNVIQTLIKIMTIHL